MASTTSALLSQEVYLTDRLDNPTRERMPHLKCICFLRPSPESLRALEDELRNPKYSGYWLYFSNVLKKSAIERLAEADESELVREIQVRIVVGSHLVILNNPFCRNTLPTTHR
jgi:hypothetical protein